MKKKDYSSLTARERKQLRRAKYEEDNGLLPDSDGKRPVVGLKKKRNRSTLTAKERKQLRRAMYEKKEVRLADGVDKRSVMPSPQNAMSAEAAMARSQRQSKISAIVVCCIVSLSVLLIVAALIIPVVLYIINPYRDYDCIVARFDLSNGMVLEYVIEEDKYDTAATNFIFLAKNKYFDNTVFYDAQGGWLRFGGYERQPMDGSASLSDYNRAFHHSTNSSFCSGFAALPNNRFQRVTDKFGYRIRPDAEGTGNSVTTQIGVLTMRTDTATEFQFRYDVNPTDETVSGDILALQSTRVGRALNDETINNIKQISSTRKLNTAISSGYKWCPPTPDIRIKTVKVYNLNARKWDEFDFLKYLGGNNKNGERRYTQWIGIN